MKVSFYIAKRYLFAKKTHNIINIISTISVVGITIGTAALIIVLSVFNGFENLVVSMFNSFNPDLQVTVNIGKNFREEQIPMDKIYAISGISHVTKVLEENALITYREKQYIATIKGVSPEIYSTSRLDSMIIDGNSRLESGDKNFAIIGQGIAYYLGLGLNDYENPLSVYVPRRFKGYQIDPMQAFNNLYIQPSGIFSVQQEYDQKYIIVPLRFARELLENPKGISALEIRMRESADHRQVQQQLQSLLGTTFTVKDRYQQEEVMYKIMRSEKMAVFIILGFILLIAVFNVIGSLSMLILDKRKDMAVLQSLGASNRLIRQIFFTEGMMITLLGAVAGLLLGGVVCWLQQRYGLLKINSHLVIVNPVKIIFMDFTYIMLIIGLNQLRRKKYFQEDMKINILGPIAGLLIGGVICWLQFLFGWIKISSSATFVVEAYPVKMIFMDFVNVLLMISLIGFVAAWYPVKYISKKHLEERL